MTAQTDIDVAFDFRHDTPVGKDPDSHSPTLRSYHQLLWSKQLPGGTLFTLDNTKPGEYLYHNSEIGEFWLTSDAVIPDFARNPKVASIIAQIPASEHEAFDRVGYTIGGMMIFPGNRIDNKMTINGARGFHPRIADRFDLTLECIRLHYAGIHDKQANPLGEVIERYSTFFELFHDFAGYVEFFHLHDLVSEARTEVNCFLRCDGFQRSPLPQDRDEYQHYARSAIAFVTARNARIAASQASTT